MFILAQAPAVFAPSSFYAAPTTRPKRLFQKNVIECVDTNESDFSCDESSGDEASIDVEDSTSEEDEDVNELDGDQSTERTDVRQSDLKSRYANKRYTWRKAAFDHQPTVYQDEFPLPPAEPPTAKQYFDMFISRSMLKEVVEETNKYYLQKNGTSLNLTVEELASVLGMFFRMGLVDMHRVRAYWETGSRYELVAQVMSRNRFEKITSHLHFTDNDAATDQMKEDKCWKVRPWLSSLRDNMVRVPQEKSSVDEILIPFRGRSHIRQYLPNKPKSKWGLKLWARAGESGLCYDFDVYQGCSRGMYGYQEGYQLGLGAGVVLQLCTSLPDRKDNLIVADNYFTGPHLVSELTSRGIAYVGTVRENRLKSCKLMDEKSMKKKGRGACDFSVASCENKSMVAVKWYDNRPVTLLSNCSGVEPTVTVKRWDKKTKYHILVECPAVILDYNKSMGGVDLLDKMCYSYRFAIRSKRWYLYIFWHTVKMAAVNAWLMQRRIDQQQGQKSAPLREFLAELATSLVLYLKRSAGRPSEENLPPAKKQACMAIPRDVRTDGTQHWPIWNERRNRCKACTGGYTFISCSKCQVSLCINKRPQLFRAVP